MKNTFVLLLAFIATFFAITSHASQFQQTRMITEISVLLVYKDNNLKAAGIVVTIESPIKTKVTFTDLSLRTVGINNKNINLDGFQQSAVSLETSHTPSSASYSESSLIPVKQDFDYIKPVNSAQHYSSLNYSALNSLSLKQPSLNSFSKLAENHHQVMF